MDQFDSTTHPVQSRKACSGSVDRQVMDSVHSESGREALTGINNYEKHDVESFIARIDESVLDKMMYLQATLSETLRLYPAVPVDGRVAEDNDTLPDGHKLSKGDGVFYISYAMGRMT